MAMDFLSSPDVLSQPAEPLQVAISLLCQACKDIGEILKTQEVITLNTANEFGDNQLSVDMAAEQILRKIVESPANDGVFHGWASEEDPSYHTVKEQGHFKVFWDPLDGSSIIDANWSVGTIIGITDSAWTVGKPLRQHMKAAVVGIYGPRTTILVAYQGVALEVTQTDGKPQFKRLQIREIEKGLLPRHFSPANLRCARFMPEYRSLIDRYIDEGKTLRYSGGLVPDLYHILVKEEGVYYSPACAEAPAKLRMMFELGPVAYLMEAAGGRATSYKCPDLAILDCVSSPL